jgi:hypothetical protein
LVAQGGDPSGGQLFSLPAAPIVTQIPKAQLHSGSSVHALEKPTSSYAIFGLTVEYAEGEWWRKVAQTLS